MSRTLLAAALLATALVSSLLVAPAEAASLPSRKQWRSETYSAMSGSRIWLRKNIKGVEHPAVNLDIDNTSLATHYAPGKPISVVLRFVKYADYKGATIVFSTGRRDTELKGITKTLRKAGFKTEEHVVRARPGKGARHVIWLATPPPRR